MLKIMLTPIPAGVIYSEEKSVALKLNVLVSFKSTDPKQQFIKLTDIKYQDFPNWIVNVKKNITINIKPDNDSSLLTKAQFNPCQSETAETIANNWNTLFEDSVFKAFSDQVNQDHFDPIKHRNLKNQNEKEVKRLTDDFQKKSNETSALQKTVDNLIQQKPLLDSILKSLKSDDETLNPEVKQLKTLLIDPELNSSLRDVNNFEKRSELIRDRYGKTLKKRSAELEKAKNERDSIKSNLNQQKWLKDELNKTTESGVLNITDQDLTKLKNILSDLQKNSDGKIESVNQENEYTSKINSSRPVYLNDVIGYFFNYPNVLYNIGIMHCFELKLDAIPFPDNLVESGQLSLNLPANLDTTEFSLIRSELDIKKVAYQIFNYSDLNTNRIHFMPRPNPNPTSKESLYDKGFLNLIAKGDKDQMHFDLLQNNPQQMNYQQATLQEDSVDHTFVDHTKGFFLIRLDTSKHVESPDKTDDSNKTNDVLYLEDFLIGYRVDMRRRVEGSTSFGQWKSLHKRVGKIKLNNTFKVEDEGWITKEALVEVKRKVFVTRKDLPDTIQIPFNIYTMETGEYAIVSREDYILSVTINDESANDQPQKIFVLKLDPSKDNSSVFNKLRDRLAKWSIGGVSNLSCNDDGEFFYNTYESVSSSSLLPSSVICSINGYSLSAPVVLSNKLKKEYQKQAANSKSQIKQNALSSNKSSISLTEYFAHCGVEIGDMSPSSHSLPLLRLNDNYQIRCRLVTLDGTSLPLTADTNKYIIEKQYLRQDSISAPLLIPPSNIYSDQAKTVIKDEFKGEFNHRIVVCQDDNKKVSTRYILPPVSTWQMAEWSKMMDKNNLPDSEEIKKFADGYMPKYVPEKPNSNVYVWDKQGRPIEYYADGYKIDYIPDPLAKFFQISITDRNTNNIINTYKGKYLSKIFSFYTDPKDPKPYKAIVWRLDVRVTNGTELPGTFSSNNGLITIKIPPGEDIEFIIKSLPIDSTIADLRTVPHFYAPKSSPNKVIINEDFSYPSFIGEKIFQAIHAIRKLNNYPSFLEAKNGEPINIRAYRQGNPFAISLDAGIYFPGKTSDQLELYAQWTDTIDDPNNEEPVTLKTTTKRVYDFFDLKKDAILQTMNQKNKNNDQRIIFDDIKLYFDKKRLGNITHDLPDSKCRKIRYWLKTRNRFSSFLKNNFYDGYNPHPDEKSKWDLAQDIKSSLPPEKPSIAYVLPAFNWNFKGDHIRQGNTIRVYINRPWFSSGIGELLAILVPDDKLSTDELTLVTPYCSSWGNDITSNKNPLPPLIFKDFKSTGIPPDAKILNIDNSNFRDANKSNFALVLHEVFFSKEKNLWYADISFNTPVGSYTPFVKLSLARYQPNSEDNKFLSDYVLTDYIQLQPSRQVNYLIQNKALTIIFHSYTSDIQTKEVRGKVANRVYASVIETDGNESGSAEDIIFNKEKIKLKNKPFEYHEANQNWLCQFDMNEHNFPNGNYVVIVREYEDFGAVNDDDESNLRLVFADTISSNQITKK